MNIMNKLCKHFTNTINKMCKVELLIFNTDCDLRVLQHAHTNTAASADYFTLNSSFNIWAVLLTAQKYQIFLNTFDYLQL